MKHPNTHGNKTGETIGTVFSRALVSITVTIINFWGKAKKKGK